MGDLGLLYNKATSDIAMEVLKQFRVKEKGVWKLKVMWWNIGKIHSPFCMLVTQKLVLTDKQFREWTPIKPEGVR